jgi:hypothetical protein
VPGDSPDAGFAGAYGGVVVQVAAQAEGEVGAGGADGGFGGEGAFGVLSGFVGAEQEDAFGGVVGGSVADLAVQAEHGGALAGGVHGGEVGASGAGLLFVAGPQDAVAVAVGGLLVAVPELVGSDPQGVGAEQALAAPGGGVRDGQVLGPQARVGADMTA